MPDLDPETSKLMTLARGARARITAAEGASLRDDMGRTYSGASVHRGSLELSAIELTVASAISSGATGIEEVVLCSDEQALRPTDAQALHSLGNSGIPVTIISMRGEVVVMLRS